jgi:chromate transporter
MNQIPALIRVFAYLSLLTVGGGMAAFPEMKILTVEVHKWLTFTQLIHIYSVGQMYPGPNMMMIVVIGQWAGGFLGALVVLIAFFGPTALLAFIVARLWKKLEKWPWRTSIQQGLAPVSIGLLLAGWLLHHGKRCNLRCGNCRDCRWRPADLAAVQGQPCVAGTGRGRGRIVLIHA